MNNDQPPIRTTTVYDGAGRVVSVTDELSERTAYVYCSPAARPPAETRPREPQPPMPLVKHTFEFRLAGAEEQEQALEQPPVPAGAAVLVTADSVRTFLPRSPDAAGAAIGSVEVRTAARGNRLVCTATVADFAPSDLVVVQVDASAYLTQAKE